MLWTGLLAGGWKPSSTLDHQSTRGNALGSHTTNAVFVITHWVAAAGSSVTRSPWRPRTVADGTSSAVPCWLWVGETRSHRGRDPHHWTAAAACHGQRTGNLLAYLLHWQRTHLSVVIMRNLGFSAHWNVTLIWLAGFIWFCLVHCCSVYDTVWQSSPTLSLLSLSLPHIHLISFMAVHCQFLPSMTPALFHSTSKTILFHNPSHHKLLIPGLPWWVMKSQITWWQIRMWKTCAGACMVKAANHEACGSQFLLPHF